MKIFNKKSNKISGLKPSNRMSGFTIIETLVAVFILSISITSFLSLVSQSILTARYAKNEITANYLAQEAADYIRNERDSFVFLGNGDWVTFLISKFGNYPINDKCYSNDGCYFNVVPGGSYTSTNISLCDFQSNKCPPVQINGKNSNFTRKIKVKNYGDNEIHIHIIVEWLNGNSTKTKELRFSLTNWMNY